MAFLDDVREYLTILKDVRGHRAKLKKLDKKLRKAERCRDSIGEVVGYVGSLGFTPRTVVDVGINMGTEGLYDTFPEAKYLLVDPLKESEVFMRAICGKLADAHYVIAAAGARRGEVELSVPPSFGGAVVTTVNAHANAEKRKVPLTTLDSLVEEKRAVGPFLLKIDTEGSELEVLLGASQMLKQTEVIILEARVRPVGSAPQFFEILQFLKSCGFVLYDLIDRNYHDRDKTLKQLDIVVVKENGFFRTPQKYKKLGAEPEFDVKDFHEKKLERRRKAEASL